MIATLNSETPGTPAQLTFHESGRRRTCPRCPVRPVLLTLLIAAPLVACAPRITTPFRITVIDSETGRGVPLVTLTTTSKIQYVTDSAGIIAFDEPGLMGLNVHFAVESHGYSYPKDGFGFAGAAVQTNAGGSATLTIHRDNIAERLYRITGQGIYHDSILLGDKPPIEQPLLNGKVMGQDSVQAVVYRDKIHWFWGDTNRPGYPLGNFHVSGAVSDLPENGGLSPDIGVNLDYFVDENGFSRPMAKLPGPGAVWIGPLILLPHEEGRERLYAGFVRVQGLEKTYERGLLRYNDDLERFEPFASFDVDAVLHPQGEPLRIRDQGADYIYFCSPFPLVRVPANLESLSDPNAYEAYTCLESGTQFEKENSRIDRDPQGRPVWAWKPHTGPLNPQQQQQLVDANLLQPGEPWIRVRDVDTGAPVLIHAGTLRWNDYRQRYILIGEQVFGSSLLGEIWYSEAPTPMGPWDRARKIVTHDNYSFYNPAHHPFFDEDGGRVIYFEGTYANFLTDAPATPRYDYNQILYRLRLDHPRLTLPEPPTPESPGDQRTPGP